MDYDLIDVYFFLQNQIYKQFGYVEDWKVIPLEDSREFFWKLDGLGPGEVRFADTEEELSSGSGAYYVDLIYTQRHLPKWVYQAKHYTLVCVDTQTDGNKLLRIFDNSKERTLAF